MPLTLCRDTPIWTPAAQRRSVNFMEKHMAGSVNKVILIGNLGRDPEVRTFQNGGKVVNLRLATTDTWRDRTSGERREKTEWHSVAIMSEPLANIAEKYLRKGSSVYIEGALETRKWQDQSGQDRYSTEVVLRPFSGSLTLLGGRGEGGGGAGGRGDAGGGYDDRGGYDDYGQGAGGGQGGGQGGGFGGSAGGGGRGGYGGGAAAGAGSSRSDLDDDIPF